MDGSVLPVANSAEDSKLEIALDTQWAHAVAPAASILLVIAKSSACTAAVAAVKAASLQPNVVAISISWSCTEFPNETSSDYDGLLATIQASGIVLVTSSGDNGDIFGMTQRWPAVSPYVTTVGGTTIQGTPASPPTNTTEITWSRGGGGIVSTKPCQPIKQLPVLELRK